MLYQETDQQSDGSQGTDYRSVHFQSLHADLQIELAFATYSWYSTRQLVHPSGQDTWVGCTLCRISRNVKRTGQFSPDQRSKKSTAVAAVKKMTMLTRSIYRNFFKIDSGKNLVSMEIEMRTAPRSIKGRLIQLPVATLPGFSS